MARTTGTIHRLLERLWQGDAVVSEELYLRMTQGTELVVLLCTDVVGPDEEIRWIGSRAPNRSARAQAHGDPASLAFQDPPSGLADRRTVEEHGTRHRAVSELHDTQIGMILLDLGQLETINDRFGHRTGDAVLTEVARRLKAGVRKADIVARVGDDAFLVLLPEVKNLGNVETVAHRIERALASPIAVMETEISVRAGMGMALCPDHGSSLEQFVRTADRAISGRGAGPSQAM